MEKKLHEIVDKGETRSISTDRYLVRAFLRNEWEETLGDTNHNLSI